MVSLSFFLPWPFQWLPGSQDSVFWNDTKRIVIFSLCFFFLFFSFLLWNFCESFVCFFLPKVERYALHRSPQPHTYCLPISVLSVCSLSKCSSVYCPSVHLFIDKVSQSILAIKNSRTTECNKNSWIYRKGSKISYTKKTYWTNLWTETNFLLSSRLSYAFRVM